MSRHLLHVVPAVAERYGGPSAAALGMCRALGAAGHETLLVATDADGAGRLDVPVDRDVDYHGVRARFFPRRGSESFKWSAPLARWLRHHVADFDLVHAHAVFSHSTIAAGRACRAAGVPYVVRPLGTLDPWSLRRHRRRKRLLLGLGLRSVLTSAAAMHYTTVEEERLAEDQLPGLPRGYVVPLGLDEGWFVAPDARREDSVVMLGRLDPKKGIDVAIRAFHLLDGTAAMRRWTLTIAGAGDAACEEQLRQLARRGPSGTRIRFAGWVAGDARAELLGRARLFLMPSYQENFGIAALEAMARGTPALVAPGVNLASAIARAGAGWVAEATPDALARALVTALADRVELARRGARARRLAESYRWPAVVAALDVMYGEVAARAGLARAEPAATHGGAR